MQTIRIFLSADKSLKEERQELSDLVENLNQSLESRDANILMLVWDGDADKAEFDKQMSNTDLCLTLYYETFTDSTQSELESAYQSLCEGKNPKKIYVYFKNTENVPEKLQEFRDSFPTKYGHFYCSFSNIDTLKADFLLQFMEYQSKCLGTSKLLEVSNGKVIVDGTEYVNLKNVPFAGNNEEYNLLLKSIKKTQKLLAITDEGDEEYAEYAAELQDLKDKLAKMESSLWDTALMITRLSTTKCSERLKRAMDLFTAGDNKGAQAVLNEEEIEKDVEHNLRLIQLGEEGKKGLKINIEEYKLKIRTLENDITKDHSKLIIKLYKKATLAAKDHIDVSEYIDLLWDFAFYVHYQNLYMLSSELYEECLSLIRNNITSRNEDEKYNLALFLNDIANFHRNAGEFNKAVNEYLESVEIRRDLVEINKDFYLPGLSRSLEDFALLKSDLGDYVTALELIEEALSYRREFHQRKRHSNSSEKYAHCLGSYAIVLAKRKDLDSAIEAANESIRLLRELKNQENEDLDLKKDIASFIENLSLYYMDSDRYDAAKSLLEESLEIFKLLYNLRPNAYGPDFAISLLNMGVFYNDTENFSEAINHATSALSIFFKLEEINCGVYQADIALCQMNRANSYQSLGNYEKAEEDFADAIKIFRTLSNEGEDYCSRNLASCLVNYSTLLRDKLDYQNAMSSISESIEIYRRLSQANPKAYKPDLAKALSILGNLSRIIKQGERAEQALKEAIELLNSLDDIRTYAIYLAEAYLYLGRVYYSSLNKPEEAIIALTQSIQYYKDIGGKSGVDLTHELGMAYSDLASGYYRIDPQSPMVESMYKESIKILELSNGRNETRALANSLNNLAWFYYEKGELIKAEPLAKKAIKLEESFCKALGQDSSNIADYRDTLQKILENKQNNN